MMLASGSWDDSVMLWSKDGHRLNKLKGHKTDVEAVAWSPDGALLASGGDDDKIFFWV